MSLDTYDNGKPVISNGFFGGFSLMLPIYQNISLVPGAYYSYLTKEDVTSFGPISGTLTVEEHYITIPLYLKFTVPVSQNFSVFVTGGPRFAAGIISSTSGKGTVSGLLPTDVDIDNYKDDDTYSRYDLQLGAGGGIELLRNIQLQVTYNWGMLNKYIGDAGVIRKRNVLELSASFYF